MPDCEKRKPVAAAVHARQRYIFKSQRTETLLPQVVQSSLINMRIISTEALPKKLLRLSASIFFLLVTTSLAQSPAASSGTTAPTAPGYLDPLPQDTGTAGLKQELRKLQTTGRLMMVVAHPDDEDGGLLTLEARGKGVQTLLMTLTRGEGGQNKTGDTFSDELGILRTLELLAADKYYGVEQRFSRVADFGYSKTADETFQKWSGHDVPLQDIVRVIREFRPDVLVARFSGTENDGHGHHQASSILTQEAFRAAADPNRFPEQIKQGLQPWQPKKLYIGNVCGFGASSCPDENYTVKLNTGEDDPVLGMSYVQFAVEGLKHQQSQGLADIKIPSGPRYAFYKLVDSHVPNTKDEKGHEKDLFDGIDTGLTALTSPAGDLGIAGRLNAAATEINEALRVANQNQPAVAAPLLSALRQLNVDRGVQGDTPGAQSLITRLRAKEDQIRTALNLALNVELTGSVISPAATSNAELAGISPGQKFALKVHFHNGSKYALKLDALVVDGIVSGKGAAVDERQNEPPVAPGADYDHIFQLQLPEVAATKTGYHRDDPQRDSVYAVDQPQLLTLPFATTFPAIIHARYEVPEIASAKGSAESKYANLPEISAPATIPVKTKQGTSRNLRLAVVPAFSISVLPGEEIISTNSRAAVEVTVKALSNVDGAPSGRLRLEAPSGWRVRPSTQVVSISHRGDDKDFHFTVSPPGLNQGQVKLNAELQAGGKKYEETYDLVTREDLGSFYYFQPAVQRVSIVDVKVPTDLKVGYIMGAGDDIPTVLQQIGMNVTLIPAEKFAIENVSRYGSIVLGVRAYDTQKEIAANNQKLLDFVRNGGTLIVQNNNSVSDFNGDHFTPYPAELSRARVSVEEAPVQILVPDSPIFHYPNEISQKDFDGWVQERGLYFMDKWDDHFTPLLSCHDPNESDQKGGLLVAKYGKGTYIYTGYAFFRQLPAGVPGAVRLFVNLVAAGTAASSH
jgi:LmbE family N-acetylglucosaminyl deacetylase